MRAHNERQMWYKRGVGDGGLSGWWQLEFVGGRGVAPKRGAAKAVAVATILNRDDDGPNWLDRQAEVGVFFFWDYYLNYYYLNIKFS